MGQVNLPKVPRNVDLTQVINLINMLVDELTHLLTGHLDVKNIRAHSITADRMNVDELSAISANLGHIISGLIEAVQIYGSLIATSVAGVYPRIELSSADNLLKAELDANNRLRFVPNFLGSPAIVFDTNGTLTRIFSTAAGGPPPVMGILSNAALQLTGTEVYLLPSSGNVMVPNWSRLENDATGQTLQQALDAKANAFFGYTGSFVVDGKTITVSNGIITSVI